jgi:hypothetical protein
VSRDRAGPAPIASRCEPLTTNRNRSAIYGYPKVKSSGGDRHGPIQYRRHDRARHPRHQESSDTRCQELVDRAQEHGRPVRILYISDFDPAGMSMPVACARKIEHRLRTDHLDLDIEVRPVALTYDQCRQYRLPRTPIKESELRADLFEKRFGEGATELDALEALHPGALRRILVDEIARYYDRSLNARVEKLQTRSIRDSRPCGPERRGSCGNRDRCAAAGIPRACGANQRRAPSHCRALSG